jgi:hypothetical protein
MAPAQGAGDLRIGQPCQPQLQQIALVSRQVGQQALDGALVIGGQRQRLRRALSGPIHQISRGRERFPWVLVATHIHDDVVGNGEEPGAEAVIPTRRQRRQRFGEDQTRGILGRVTVS